MLNKLSTQNLTHDEWLAKRSKSIGGSDAAAIIGLSDWSSPYTIWAEKTGKIPYKTDNEAMRQGRDLEEYVSKRFCEKTGKKVERCNYILTNSDFPFAHANIDRKIVGERAGLECKTTNALNLKKFSGGEFPANYYAQCMHYMAVTGFNKWYLAVLILGREFLVYEIERDEKEIKALMEAEKNFWKFVQNDVAPPVDGLEATAKTINCVFSESNGDTLDLYGFEKEVEAYIEAEKSLEAARKYADTCKNAIKAVMGEYETAISPRAKFTWKNQTRKYFDLKTFQKDFPDIDLSGYFNISKSRVFTTLKK